MMEEYETKRILILLAVVTSLCHVQGDAANQKSCTNGDGEVIPHGKSFVPDYNDPCKTCTCDNGFTILCRTAACSPPPRCKKTIHIPRKCCQFICEGNDSQPPSLNTNTTVLEKPATEEDNITNLSLRLVASTVTSFLVLALLLFMVHRLRQRRLMMAMRRFEAQARQQRGDEDDVDHYIPAAFLHIECPPYEDPPPPYSPPKPPHILPEDSPPPYRELENDALSDLDANANISNNNINNNNNNNDQSCTQHRQGNASHGVNNNLDTSRQASSGNNSSLNSTENGGTSMGARSGHFCSNSNVGARTGAPSQGREDETEMTLMSRQESYAFERNGVTPFHHQDYSLFPPTSTARNMSSNSTDQTGEVVTDRFPLKRNSDSHGAGASQDGGRGGRKTGRSCSFSFTHNPDQDLSMSGIALAPMSQSYHASTTDSSVQTPGSYTASLSRHRARAANASADPMKNIPKQERERSSEQRMVTKPMAKCEASVQHSHRLLQEELKRNLPATFVDVHDGRQQNSGSINPAEASSSQDSAAALCDGTASQNRKTGKNSVPDPDIGISSGHAAGLCGQLPRSQSINSTFSVCSETGEVHVKKAFGDAGDSVLQSDSQYPQHRVPKSSTPSPSQPAPLACSPSSPENPSSLPNYTFPINAAHYPSLESPHCANGQEFQITRAKPAASAMAMSRRPVANPPSQELRTGTSPSGGRSQSAKPKHKKIHFVPLEKSKTFKSKKDKSKSSKKGEADHSGRCRDSGPRTNSFCNFHGAPTEESSQSRIHQSKLTDLMRGRLATNAPSVKEYGFLDTFPSGPPENGYAAESGFRNADCGSKDSHGNASCVGNRAGSTAYHSLPHKPHTHGLAVSHHQAGHRRQFSHGDKPSHTNPSSTRPKNKPRPVSGGLVVEAGRDPADPVAALPQNSIARRRMKTLYVKKSRQSYPVPDSTHLGDRKANCVDLGFVEPCPDSGRTVCADADIPTFTLPTKRRALDKGCDKAGPAEILEGRMSSYV